MNTKLLKEKIEEIHIPLSSIAERRGISRNTLYLKLSGKRPLKMSEATKIGEILRLTNKEKTDIFLAGEDDKTTH